MDTEPPCSPPVSPKPDILRLRFNELSSTFNGISNLINSDSSTYCHRVIARNRKISRSRTKNIQLLTKNLEGGTIDPSTTSSSPTCLNRDTAVNTDCHNQIFLYFFKFKPTIRIKSLLYITAGGDYVNRPITKISTIITKASRRYDRNYLKFIKKSTELIKLSEEDKKHRHIKRVIRPTLRIYWTSFILKCLQVRPLVPSKVSYSHFVVALIVILGTRSFLLFCFLVEEASCW